MIALELISSNPIPSSWRTRRRSETCCGVVRQNAIAAWLAWGGLTWRPCGLTVSRSACDWGRRIGLRLHGQPCQEAFTYQMRKIEV